jgi:2-isopropylmalate synthase
MERVKVYDTTLRDGSQGEGVQFSAEDKLEITRRLDEFGIDYIEGGWPGSNPKDQAYFESVKGLKLEHARIAAFGSTRRASNKVEEDENIARLLGAGTPAVTIFGKCWDLHVTDVLKTDLDTNLVMIADSVEFVKKAGREVIFDAEHFFDGYKAMPDYAMKAVVAAREAGAECVVLCDTNGGCLPHEVAEVTARVVKELGGSVGIHTHNDAGLAVANTLVALKEGATHFQGTINGFGERTGNANLCSILPAVVMKLKIPCIDPERLGGLTDLSRFLYETANIVPRDHDPYVGVSAFAHKGGIHVDAVQKNVKTYEHVDPEAVGNDRRVLISELAGRSVLLTKAEKYGIERDSETMNRLLQKLKDLEWDGYEFEAAEGSFDILVKKIVGEHREFFDLEGFRVIVEKREEGRVISEATIKVKVDGRSVHTAAEGDGPVNALDTALRKALDAFYPAGLRGMHLVDYKVRVINPAEGTAAKVRVVIESSDGKDVWGTVGVSENIIEASWRALVDSVEYKLFKYAEEHKLFRDAEEKK